MKNYKSFNQWMGEQGFNALRHANCCRIAYEGGQESMKMRIDELQETNLNLEGGCVHLQKRIDTALNLIGNWWHPDVDQKLFLTELERVLQDGDVYRVLPVQMTYQGWSSQRQRSKDEFVSLTQEWHKKGYEAGQKDLREACFHFETSMFHRGTAQCFKCGAMVDRDRNIID